MTNQVFVATHEFAWDNVAVLIEDTEATVPVGTPLPDGAWIIGYKIDVVTAFSDGATGAFTLALGTDEGDPWEAAADLTDEAVTQDAVIDAAGGQQLQAVFTGDVDLDTLTAGRVVLSVLYTVPEPDLD